MDTVKIVQLVETTLTRRGEGKNLDDPVRVITQYWDFDGKLMWEKDPFAERKASARTASYTETGGLTPKGLADELHNAGLSALQIPNNRSAEDWENYRVKLAAELLTRINVIQKS